MHQAIATAPSLRQALESNIDTMMESACCARCPAVTHGFDTIIWRACCAIGPATTSDVARPPAFSKHWPARTNIECARRSKDKETVVSRTPCTECTKERGAHMLESNIDTMIERMLCTGLAARIDSVVAIDALHDVGLQGQSLVQDESQDGLLH